jgi:zinc transport system permease protein
VVLYALSAAIPIFVILNRRKINAVLFDRDIAFSTGIDSRRFFYIILMLTGTVVAVSMKIVGALLTDSLLILPALAALSLAKSMRGMFVISVVFGFLSALFGFLFSLVMEVQPGPAVTLVSLVLFAGFYAIQAIQNRKGVSA